jgi:Zn-dependent peptidase ImmA (M78 family)
MCKAPRSNNFAVEIVAHALLRAASSLHSTPLRPGNAGVGFLRELARKYRVSTQALVNRLKNLGYIQD